MRRVSFINTEPSEREYFDEYDNYNETSLWFFMIYILRTFVPFCLALQVKETNETKSNKTLTLNNIGRSF
jgi:hypothetical protein